MQKRVWMAVGIVALLTACSGAPKTNPTPMNAAEAKVAAEAALNDLSMAGLVNGPTNLIGQNLQAAQALGLPLQAAGVLEGLGINLSQAISAGCSFDLQPKLPTDADADFTPAKVSLSVECAYSDDNNTAETTDDVGYSYSGQLSLEDTNDSLANSGFKLNLQGFKERAQKGLKVFERTLEGAYTLEIPQGASAYKVDKGYKAAVSYTDGSKTDTASTQYAVKESYTPDSPLRPKRAGSYSVDASQPGSLSLSRNTDAYRWAWHTQPTLHYNAACTAKTPKGLRLPFDSGGAVYRYTNPNGSISKLEIGFTGCGVYTLSLDGQAIE